MVARDVGNDRAQPRLERRAGPVLPEEAEPAYERFLRDVVGGRPPCHCDRGSTRDVFVPPHEASVCLDIALSGAVRQVGFVERILRIGPWHALRVVYTAARVLLQEPRASGSVPDRSAARDRSLDLYRMGLAGVILRN